MSFAYNGTGAIPILISGIPIDTVIFNNIQIKQLGFTRRAPVGSGSEKFISTVNSGTIWLNEVSEKFTLNMEDFISLSIKEGRIIQTKIMENINLYFEGIVNDIKIGPENDQRSIMPTWLEYLYTNQRLAFFWGAIIFIWSLLWGIKNASFK